MEKSRAWSKLYLTQQQTRGMTMKNHIRMLAVSAVFALFAMPASAQDDDGGPMTQGDDARYLRIAHVKYKPGQGVVGGVRTIGVTGWKTFPSAFRNDLDAALMQSPTRAFFLKGNEYIKYEPGRGVIAHRIIGEHEGWRTFP